LNFKGPRSISSGVLFHDVTWNDYEAMLRIVGERPIRVTYNQGTMEVFMPSLGHEGDAYLLGRMVDTLTEELAIAKEGQMSDATAWIRSFRAFVRKEVARPR